MEVQENLNPAVDQGLQYFNTGRIVFTDGSRLDLTKSAFHIDGNTYCVVPVVFRNETMLSYDFWAVGIDCCYSTFKCGEYDNQKASAGLRVVSPAHEMSYRLAVAEAKAEFSIQTMDHPIFVHWMRDPAQTVNWYRDQGILHYHFMICGYFLLQTLLVSAVTTIFWWFAIQC